VGLASGVERGRAIIPLFKTLELKNCGFYAINKNERNEYA
jgi:hypothetical protein